MQLGRLVLNSILVAAGLVLLTSLPALAQRPGGGGPPPGGGGGMPGGGMPGGANIPGGPSRNNDGSLDTRSSGSPSIAPSQQGGSISTMRGGLQLGPPGRFWDDKHYVKALHLRPDQQKRMDGLFDENRATLVSRYQTLQQEESRLETLSHAQTLDEASLFAQIDRVSQARADLEKANTHLMLQVRKEMDADQVARLDNYR
jgi:Spy/CpxP family protein refolding chaperone